MNNTATAQPATGVPTPLLADWRDYFALLKPRVMTLVIFTAICGLLAAPGTIHPVIGFTAILAIALAVGSVHWLRIPGFGLNSKILVTKHRSSETSKSPSCWPTTPA